MKFGVDCGNSAQVAVVGFDAAPLVPGATTASPANSAPAAIANVTIRFRCPFMAIALPCYAAVG